MKVLVDNIYAKLDIADTIVLGTIVDSKVLHLENVIANYYNVSKSSLLDWRCDSKAKKMLCFVLHHHLHYAIGSLASRYCINHLYLRKCILEIYTECLQNNTKKLVVDGLIERLNHKVIGIKKRKQN